MSLSRRNIIAGAAATGALPLSLARAQAANTIRIGVMTDMSGTYRDNTGPTSVAAASSLMCRLLPWASLSRASRGKKTSLIFAWVLRRLT